MGVQRSLLVAFALHLYPSVSPVARLPGVGVVGNSLVVFLLLPPFSPLGWRHRGCARRLPVRGVRQTRRGVCWGLCSVHRCFYGRRQLRTSSFSLCTCTTPYEQPAFAYSTAGAAGAAGAEAAAGAAGTGGGHATPSRLFTHRGGSP